MNTKKAPVRSRLAITARGIVFSGFFASSPNAVAHSKPTKLKIATASDAAGGSTGAILDHIRSVLALEVCHRSDETQARVAARIKSLAQQGVPVFLVLRTRAVDGTVLSDIFTRWPELCVFLYADESDEAHLREQFPGVPFLEPPLASEEEDAARIGWGDCMAEADPLADLETGAAFL